MIATATPTGTLLIEYGEEDCQGYNDGRRGFHNPVPVEPGKLLFGPKGEVQFPARLTEAEWFFADHLRDRVLAGEDARQAKAS